MKHLNIKTLYIAFVVALLSACTDDFTDINTNPNAITQDEASARYFLTVPQYQLYGPNRFPYWRAQLIHGDRFAGQVTFGHHGSWWSDALAYDYHPGYTDAAWGWLAGYIGNLDTYIRFTQAGGDFENLNMYAVGLIMKGLYFQMYTDIWGEIPYSEAGQLDILLPKFDEQPDIYQGIIAELDEAMSIIGDQTVTGDGIQNLGENDIYCGGDLQKWKRLANTLKLRIGTRALGARGEAFASAVIQEALSAPLLDGEADNVLMDKDEEISQWGSAAYGDVWHNFGGLGSKWNLSQVLIQYLLESDDPRLSRYAKPAPGGTFTFERPNAENDAEGYELFPKRVQFIIDQMRAQGAEVSVEEGESAWTVGIAENTYYLGQPVRLRGAVRSFARFEFYSEPADFVINPKNSSEIAPEIVMTAAESNFLQAQAAVNGIGNGDAQALFQEGIRLAMKIWRVDDAAIEEYLASADLAQLNGTTEENLEKIAIQRWIADFTDGYEAWAIVRKTGYPRELSEGVSDFDIFASGGDVNGAYPQRMRYGNEAYNTNPTNVEAANGRQGADRQDTKLWYAK